MGADTQERRLQPDHGPSRQGNHMYYRLQDQHVRQLVEDAIYHAEHALEHIPDHHRADDPFGVSSTRLTELPHRSTGTERVTR